MSDIMTIENLKQAFPDLYGAIEKAAYDNGFLAGQSQGKSAGLIEGAESERKRIQAVEDQLIPGHEALVASLKYDGATTGPEAAVKIVAAQKQLLTSKLADFQADHNKLAAPAAPPDPGKEAAAIAAKDAADSSLSIEDATKKAWDADPALRAEFGGSYDEYLAFAKADAAGQVKIYKGKGGN